MTHARRVPAADGCKAKQQREGGGEQAALQRRRLATAQPQPARCDQREAQRQVREMHRDTQRDQQQQPEALGAGERHILDVQPDREHQHRREDVRHQLPSDPGQCRTGCQKPHADEVAWDADLRAQAREHAKDQPTEQRALSEHERPKRPGPARGTEQKRVPDQAVHARHERGRTFHVGARVPECQRVTVVQRSAGQDDRSSEDRAHGTDACVRLRGTRSRTSLCKLSHEPNVRALRVRSVKFPRRADDTCDSQRGVPGKFTLRPRARAALVSAACGACWHVVTCHRCALHP